MAAGAVAKISPEMARGEGLTGMDAAGISGLPTLCAWEQ